MRKFPAFTLFALPLLLVLALGAVGCGKTTGSGGGGNTVEMASATFVTSSVTIPAGGTVKFVDPSSTGGVHLLCLGQNMSCDGSIKNGPPELSNPSKPVTFNNGDSKTYTFPTKGDFPVTCTVHSNMDMVVHVQ
jgi:plastocyanin